MRNKVVKKLLMIAMAVTMISGTSIATVYANANPPAEETTTQVVEETTTESTEDTEKKEDTGRVTGEGENSAFSTPGNAQLVDDKENDDTKQFLTIQTKKGNTFYMVIDRSGTSENVYMMSLVDENDLAEFLDETKETEKKEEQLHAAGVETVSVPDADGRVDLRKLMEYLGKQGIDSVLLEGGGTLNDAALSAGIVNEICAFIAPKIFGGAGAKTPVSGIGVAHPAEAVMLTLRQMETIGDDLMLRYSVD